MKKLTFAILFVSMLFSPFSNVAAAATELTLSDVLQIANVRREGITQPDYRRLTELTYGRTPQTLRMDQFFRNTPLVSSFPAEDAMHDARLLFDVMRQVYGAYTYFGGDEVFDPIFANILAAIGTQRYWNIAEFATLLRYHIGAVVSDNHFHIGGRRFEASANFFTGFTVFDRTESGFRNRSNGLYVTEVAGHDKDDVFRLSLNSRGEFFYAPVAMFPGSLGRLRSVYPLTVRYENGTEETLSLFRHIPGRLEFQYSSLTYEHGFPLVTVRQMGFDATPLGEDARRFLSFAEHLQNEEVVIVDVRSNGGGNGVLPRKWLHSLTGEVVPTNFVSLHVRNYPMLMYMLEHHTSPEGAFYIPFDDLLMYMPAAPMGAHHTIMDNTPNRMVQNNQLLILLIDRYSASAAEGFADMLFNMENTLIIGQNSGGVLHTDLTYPILNLPRTGLSFGLGRAINLHPPGHLVEGIGIAPDVWVTGDALQAVLAMLEAQL